MLFQMFKGFNQLIMNILLNEIFKQLEDFLQFSTVSNPADSFAVFCRLKEAQAAAYVQQRRIHNLPCSLENPVKMGW